MAHQAHDEFPPLTQDAEELLLRVEQALHPWVDRKDEPWGQEERTLAAAVIREANRQAARGPGAAWSKMDLIADNLHSPPPPPTLEDLNQAVRELEGWDGGMEIRTSDWIRERVGTIRRGIDHHLKG